MRICEIRGRFLIGVLSGGAAVSARLCRLPEQEVHHPTTRILPQISLNSQIFLAENILPQISLTSQIFLAENILPQISL